MNDKNVLYDIERILDKRVKDGQLHYYIKWINYPIEECTWEPATKLTDLKYLVRNFNVFYSRHVKRLKKLKNIKKQYLLKEDLSSKKFLFSIF